MIFDNNETTQHHIDVFSDFEITTPCCGVLRLWNHKTFYACCVLSVLEKYWLCYINALMQ